MCASAILGDRNGGALRREVNSQDGRMKGKGTKTSKTEKHNYHIKYCARHIPSLEIVGLKQKEIILVRVSDIDSRCVCFRWAHILSYIFPSFSMRMGVFLYNVHTIVFRRTGDRGDVVFRVVSLGCCISLCCDAYIICFVCEQIYIGLARDVSRGWICVCVRVCACVCVCFERLMVKGAGMASFFCYIMLR